MYTDVIDPGINYTQDKTQKLKKACDDFEALFLSKMFDTMRQSTLVGSEDDELIKKNEGEQIFTQMLDSQIAQDFTKQRSMGLSDMLYKSLAQYADTKGPAQGNNFPNGEKKTADSDSFIKLRQQLNGTNVASDMVAK